MAKIEGKKDQEIKGNLREKNWRKQGGKLTRKFRKIRRQKPGKTRQKKWWKNCQYNNGKNLEKSRKKGKMSKNWRINWRKKNCKEIIDQKWREKNDGRPI